VAARVEGGKKGRRQPFKKGTNFPGGWGLSYRGILKVKEGFPRHAGEKSVERKGTEAC